MSDNPITDCQLKWLSKLQLSPCPIVVDVGANTGCFAEAVFDLWQRANVLCFEPNPVAANQITERAWTYRIGLSNKNINQHLYTGDGPDMTASLYHRYDWPKHGYKVPLRRLDEVFPLLDIDLLKVDAEGHELAILEGAGKLLEKTKVIQWEFNDCQVDARVFYKDFFELLDPLGFTLGKIDEDTGDVWWIKGYTTQLENFTTHRELVACRALV